MRECDWDRYLSTGRPRAYVRFDERGEVSECWLRSVTPGDDPEAERGLRAMLLAPTLEVCRTLLRGERVPRELLDPDGLARFTPDFLTLDDFRGLPKAS